MRIYKENNYGADADGNRGQQVIEAELDSTDYDDVVDRLYDYFVDGNVSGRYTIELDGFEFEVDISDYLCGLYDIAIKDPKFINDPELMQWLEDEKPLSRKK